MNFNDFYAICIDMIKKNPHNNDPVNRTNNPGFRFLQFIVMPKIRHSRMVSQCVDNDQTDSL